MAISKFQGGKESVYTCTCCGIRTRQTQAGGEAQELCLCDDCYELAGFENMVQDGEELSSEDAATIERHVSNIKKKGGNWRAACELLTDYL